MNLLVFGDPSSFQFFMSNFWGDLTSPSHIYYYRRTGFPVAFSMGLPQELVDHGATATP